jgi:hypothetical protein
MSKRPHFPIATLIYNGNLIITAAQAHPEIAARLPANYISEAGTLLGKITADLTGQKNAQGELGNLTAAQNLNLGTLLHCMNQARKTAKLAFPGQTVKLHQEFQVGPHEKNDLGTVLNRADIILAAVVSNLPALKLKGWTDAETNAFTTARATFGTATPAQQAAKSGAKDSTNTKNADAATLYENLLTIQNAADLQWPPEDLANAGVRDEFRLNTFPPAGGNGNGTPAPATPPATPHP